MIIQASNRVNLQNEIAKKVNDFLMKKVVVISDDSMTSMDDGHQNYLKPSDVRTALDMIFNDTFDSAIAMGDIDEWIKFDEHHIPDRIHQRFICQKDNGMVVELEWRQYVSDKEKFGFFYREIDQTSQILYYRNLPKARNR